MQSDRHAQFGLVALACFACQAGGQQETLAQASAERVHDAVVQLSPEEHERMTAALTALCPPSHTPYPPHARADDYIEVDYETGDRLTELDVAQILHVAAAAGFDEPLRLHMEGSRDPDQRHGRVLTAVVENEVTRIRSEEWLRVTYSDWRIGRPNVDQLVDGGWKLAAPARESSRSSYFRNGTALWEFQLDPMVSYRSALDLFRALGEGEYQVARGIEVPARALLFQLGSLGSVECMESVRRRFQPRQKSSLEAGWNWDLLLSHSTGGNTGYSMLLARRAEVWTIVHIEQWNHH